MVVAFCGGCFGYFFYFLTEVGVGKVACSCYCCGDDETATISLPKAFCTVHDHCGEMLKEDRRQRGRETIFTRGMEVKVKVVKVVCGVSNQAKG